MKIDKRIREKYCEGFVRPLEPNEIVIHATAGGGTIEWILSGQAGEEAVSGYKKGVFLFHYLIDTKPQIIEVIDPMRWVKHSTSGAHDKDTIGIEVMKLDRYNATDITAKQYEQLDILIKDLVLKFPIERIVSHDYNAKTYSGYPPKPCPGKLDWSFAEKAGFRKSAEGLYVK